MKTDLPHCRLEHVFLQITGPDSEKTIELVNAYLHSFVGDEGKCPKCDSPLRNTMGSFYWGLVHGEAHCSGSMSNERCGWPCRAIHDIKDADGQSLFNRPLFLILPYHPEYVRNEAISPVS